LRAVSSVKGGSGGRGFMEGVDHIGIKQRIGYRFSSVFDRDDGHRWGFRHPVYSWEQVRKARWGGSNKVEWPLPFTAKRAGPGVPSPKSRDRTGEPFP
jgi:hypothetical protein